MATPTGERAAPATGALDHGVLAEVDALLATADARLTAEAGRPVPPRQPVHTVYVPADHAGPDTPARWGDRALDLLADHAPDDAALASATGLPADVVAQCYPLVLDRLRSLPVEDLRLDFEDGYGLRPDGAEDDEALRAAATITELAGGTVGAGGTHDAGRAPRWVGLRFKSLEPPTRRRGLRTLDLVVSALVAAGGLPDGFVVTLPKVTSTDQVRAMVRVCEALEAAHGLPSGRLRFEIQVETPQSILAGDGSATVAAMVRASSGRCSALHYGTYDYSASLGIAAAHQRLDHPAADHAKFVMQLAAAGTGAWLSDGSTNVVPDGDTARVHAAWRLHAGLVTRSLGMGYYQGWDMAPGHLVTRYLSTFAFFRTAFPATAGRLRAYTAKATGDVMDEPATAAALAGAVLRAVDTGAVSEVEVGEGTALSRADLEALARRTA
jgi:hypothetical protein